MNPWPLLGLLPQLLELVAPGLFRALQIRAVGFGVGLRV